MQSFSAAAPSLNALLARNVKGSTKKSVSYAIVFTGWGLGNALAPLLFRDGWAPRYVQTLKVHLAIYGVWVGVALVLRWVLIRRRDEKLNGYGVLGGGTGVTPSVPSRHGDNPLDLTDRQDPGSVYSM